MSPSARIAVLGRSRSRSEVACCWQELSEVGGMRFFMLYSNLTRAAADLGRHYGTEFRDELLRAWAV